MKYSKKQYKAIKREFKEKFPRASCHWEIWSDWDIWDNTVSLYVEPYPGAKRCWATRAICSERDIFHKRSGKFICLQRVLDGKYVPYKV